MYPRIIDESLKPDYFDFYGQSFLRQSNIQLRYLDEIAKAVLKPEIDKENILTKMKSTEADPNSKIYSSIMDICEKLGFLYFSKNQIKDIENYRIKINNKPYQIMFSPIVKFHLYHFIYSSKAILDSISVLLNDLYDLGFSGGERDIVRYGDFRNRVFEKSMAIKKSYSKNSKWFTKLLEFRDALIHRKSIIVFIKIPKKTPFDLLLKRTKKVTSGLIHYTHMPTPIAKKPKIQFKVKNGKLLNPQFFFYIMPKTPVNFEELTEKKFKKQKYFKIREFCNSGFNKLKFFAEVVFEDIHAVIMKSG